MPYREKTMRRDELTPATVIMVPSYAIFFGWLGAAYLGTPIASLLLTPAMNSVDGLINLRVWGATFLVIAASLVFAMIFPMSHRARPTASYVLLLGSVVMGIWMLFLLWASAHGDATPGAGAYAFLPMMACFASYRAVHRGV